MEYQIEVKELLIEDNKLTLNIMGTITDSVINAHFVSKPKVILHFINKREDRRIPFVLSNVIHTDGKCYFSGRYTYRLDLLFWKTAKDYLPFDMYLNFSFVDFYEEKIFGTPDEQGYSSVTKASIKRASYGQDGQPRKYPWCIQVENGKAIKEETSTGGIHMKKGTYKKDRSVFVNISDYDFYRLMLQTTRYIKAWELTVAPKRIREAQLRMEQDNTNKG